MNKTVTILAVIKKYADMYHCKTTAGKWYLTFFAIHGLYNNISVL